MDPANVEEMTPHVVAIPYPGRGHINPMMNLCHLLASRSTNILIITFVITEEWLGLIGSESKPSNIHFATIPNVVPSEFVRGADVRGFAEAVWAKMKEPFEQLLDRLELPVKFIIADTSLQWAVHSGNRRNIPVATFWPMSASMLSILFHFDLLVQNRHFPVELSERGNERVDYLPGISSMRIADLPSIFFGEGQKSLSRILETISVIPRTECLLLASIYEIEAEAIDTLKAKLPLPVYSFGPANIPYFKLKDHNAATDTTSHNDLNHLKWLDSQPRSSVLYISLGSVLSVSSDEMDEIAAGLRASGVRYLWVARGETRRLKESCGSSVGMIVPWCDQLRVLCHSSVGGFWTHCGWNSTMESVYAGVPMLAFPLLIDQITNSKFIVEDWRIGWKVKKSNVVGTENLVKRGEISELVQRFMDLESTERKEMMTRARKLKEICQQAIMEGGSSEISVNAFMRDILH